MTGITAGGIGSGLDVNGLVSQLVAAEGQPLSLRLARQEAGIQAKLSAYGSLKGAISSFQGALGALKSSAAFQTRSATSSKTDVLTASASTTAAAGTYSLTVSNLASAHSLATTSFTNLTDVVGAGTLTFSFGTTVYDAGTDTYTSFTEDTSKPAKTVTIGSTNQTLAGIRDAVNAANIGVTASIVNDGSGYRLTFASSNAGVQNSLQVTVADNDGNNTNTSGLSQLAFNASATNLQQTVAAQNAALTINGLSVSSQTNTLTNAIDGVTLNLVTAGSSTVSVSLNKGAATSSIDSFISAYNSLVDTIKSLTKYDSSTQTGGPLLSDSAARSIESQVRRMIGAPVSGVTTTYSSLASLGILTDSKTGKLVKDDTKLQKALDTNFNDVAAIFATYARPTDPLVKYVSSTSSTAVGTYEVNLSQYQKAQNASAGYHSGTAISVPITIDNSNRSLRLSVDGVDTGSFDLTNNTYASGAAMAAEVQSAINNDADMLAAGKSVAVSYAVDHLVITSNSTGASSAVTITGGSSLTVLGFNAGTSTAGQDAVTAALVGTINSSSATTEITSDGHFYLTGGVSDKTAALKLEILGGSTGARGSVQFSRGLAEQLDTYLTEVLKNNGMLDARTDGLNASIEDINDRRAALERRLTDLETRYRAQFSALDALLGQMRTTSDYLASQLATLPGTQARS